MSFVKYDKATLQKASIFAYSQAELETNNFTFYYNLYVAITSGSMVSQNIQEPIFQKPVVSQNLPRQQSEILQTCHAFL